MREIKFRGYNKEFTGNHFVYGETVLFQKYRKQWVMLIENELGEQWIDIDKPQQYIGIKDKNGKEIYEGDIVAVPFEECRIGAKEDIYNYSVIWIDEECRFCLVGNDELLGRPCCAYGNMLRSEVVGNLYENRQLLQQ